MEEYNGLSKQRKEILETIKQLGKAKPNDIVAKNPDIKNVYEQLERLLQDGYVKRISERTFALTERGEIIFEKKTEKRVNLQFTEEEIKLFTEMSKQPGWVDRLAEQLNPALLGLITERKACLLSIVSPEDKYGDRNRIHTLLSGPTSVGKSKIIEWMRDFLWGYFMDPSAKRSSIEGTGKGYQFSQGLLQRADNSTLYIDEIDKLSSDEQTTLLRAMEAGKVDVNKDRVSQQTNTRVRVIATCNNKNRLIEPLRSRFDIQLEINDLSKEDIDRLMTKRFNDWNRPKMTLEADFSLKRYLLYAAQFDVKLPEDRETMALHTKEQLKWGQLQNKDIRQIESIPRLMLGLAKIKLIKEPGEEELREVIEIIKGDAS